VIVGHGGQQAGLVVDRLHGKQQTVVKPLSRLLGSVPVFAGSTVMGNGRVALILDTGRLLRDAVGRDGALS
jgi:two-component system chemotaxis sensor kinase CheA